MNRAMYSKIVVALSDLPESQRALRAAIDLTRLCGGALATVSILGDLPAYSSFAMVVDPGGPAAMKDNQRRLLADLQERAANLAREKGLHTTSAIIEGREAQAILSFLREEGADLLVIGLHQRDFYLSRLWNSVYDLAQDAPCSVLGVH
jgi:nucleotide-binding universal stress UspA family protein